MVLVDDSSTSVISAVMGEGHTYHLCFLFLFQFLVQFTERGGPMVMRIPRTGQDWTMAWFLVVHF